MAKYRKIDFIIALFIGLLVAIFLNIIFTLQKVNLNFGVFSLKNWQIIIVLPILIFISFALVAFLSKKISILYQFAKFGLVGFLNTTIDFGVLNILVSIFKIYSGIGIVVINTISFSLAVINSYFWNKYWTFESKAGISGEEFVRFIVISIIGLLINDGVVYIITTFISPIISLVFWVNMAKILAIIIQLLWNFIGYKLIVFRKNINPPITANTNTNISKI